MKHLTKHLSCLLFLTLCQLSYAERDCSTMEEWDSNKQYGRDAEVHLNGKVYYAFRGIIYLSPEQSGYNHWIHVDYCGQKNSPAVAVFEHCNYDGASAFLPAGTYSTSALAANGMADNTVSSIYVPDGLTATLYDQGNVAGYNVKATYEDICMTTFVSQQHGFVNFNDLTSSIVVEASE